MWQCSGLIPNTELWDYPGCTPGAGWGARIKTQLSSVQGKHPTHSTVAQASLENSLLTVF